MRWTLIVYFIEEINTQKIPLRLLAFFKIKQNRICVTSLFFSLPLKQMFTIVFFSKYLFEFKNNYPINEVMKTHRNRFVWINLFITFFFVCHHYTTTIIHNSYIMLLVFFPIQLIDCQKSILITQYKYHKHIAWCGLHAVSVRTLEQ